MRIVSGHTYHPRPEVVDERVCSEYIQNLAMKQISWAMVLEHIWRMLQNFLLGCSTFPNGGSSSNNTINGSLSRREQSGDRKTA